MSYHLSHLARFSLVEEAVGLRTGKECPWRALRRGLSWDVGRDEPSEHAGAILRAVYLRERANIVDELLAHEPSLPDSWRHAAFFLDDGCYLTASELVELKQQIKTVLSAFSRPSPAERPTGATRVFFFACGLPTAGADPAAG